MFGLTLEKLSPVTLKRLRAFRKNRRAFWSLMIFGSLFVLTLFAEIIANDQPLLVKYKGEYYFPLFKTYTEQTFGGDFPTPADYRDPYIKNNIEQNGFMVFPISRLNAYLDNKLLACALLSSAKRRAISVNALWYA